jgi:hypothetical protein
MLAAESSLKKGGKNCNLLCGQDNKEKKISAPERNKRPSHLTYSQTLY